MACIWRGREGWVNGSTILDGHHVHGSVLQSWAFAAPVVNLQELRLGWSGLKDDPLPALYHLHNFSVLYVHKAYNGEQLCFSTAGSLNFKSFVYFIYDYNRERFHLQPASSNNGRLAEIDDFSQITFLRKLYFKECNDFYNMIQGDRRNSVEHIPKVLVKNQIDGMKTIEVLSWPNGITHPALSQPPGANSANHSMLLSTIATARTKTGELSYQLIGA
ncbi:hypothetical protein C4D60_Mb11t10900 [Musa balbisiana]|uniref:Uncharacterized protein n=1 Tax=Musa balbisiana TaxID=52838 RepID=A0A4S8J5P6_MUSBA|nr:hypothetical protein C4D60_Mb11t10900 [Musa balbisiana]